MAPPSTPAKDYYGILGVKADSTQEEIRSAYHRLAKEHHPDATGDTDSEDKLYAKGLPVGKIIPLYKVLPET